MVFQTAEEFLSELAVLRSDMRNNQEPDTKLVASWLNKLIMALEEFGKAQALEAQRVDTLSEA